MAYIIRYSDKVVSEHIPALPKTAGEQIRHAIETRLTVDPVGIGKPLRYTLKGYRRLRVGDWRVIYRIEGNTVFIFTIGNRKDVYDV